LQQTRDTQSQMLVTQQQMPQIQRVGKPDAGRAATGYGSFRTAACPDVRGRAEWLTDG
jgi:hypothetical protein